MRPLLLLTSGVGLLVGVASAVVWHYTHWSQLSGWTFYLPLNGTVSESLPRASWWPTGIAFPLAGIVIGAAIGGTLTKLRWRLVRETHRPAATEDAQQLA